MAVSPVRGDPRCAVPQQATVASTRDPPSFAGPTRQHMHVVMRQGVQVAELVGVLVLVAANPTSPKPGRTASIGSRRSPI
jgi:hypothetical protein